MKKIRMKNRLGTKPKKWDNEGEVVWNSKLRGPYVKAKHGDIGSDKIKNFGNDNR